jgi:hypothetical protein
MIRATIDQKRNAELFQKEDKTFSFYLYDPETAEPIDLTDKTVVCKLVNADSSVASFNGSVTSAILGKFTITITSAESELLSAIDQSIQLEITDLGGLLDIEILNNKFEVKESLF